MHLDRRKQTLLQTIVVTYVQRAEPVGSQFLSTVESLGVRSATIRNELAEMTELGYLRQPHTSAGRIPSDLGYRYYVDHLMTWDRLSPTEARTIRGAQKLSEGDLEQLLQQTCRVLSSLTGYTAMATPPTATEPAIRQVHLAQVGNTQLLAVVVLDNGQVTHRFCEAGRSLSPAEVTELGNYVDSLLRDTPVSRAASVTPAPDELMAYQDITRALLDVIARGVASEDGEIYVDGQSHMLEQPEFRESNRLEPLVRFLEERRTAYETLRQLLAERRDLAVTIGRENPHAAMQEMSLVAARYTPAARSSGWVAVIGPTRMQYAQAVSAVQYAAQALSEALSRLSGPE
ncbi:MAG: heat-inducible transcription repressor HrcA [Armatimonadetes bacterium]|jgi:heat-inducible transcriptional repressor|nr:heat-inducible transcription repressor HrcA [Armatimonadota bacterium]